jgi:hypothetical protein
MKSISKLGRKQAFMAEVTACANVEKHELAKNIQFSYYC